MKIYKNQEEVEKDVVNGTLKMCGDIKFEFDLNMDIDIKADNIKAYDIDANNISASHISACGINANDIKANGIKAHDINANDISAGIINANDIKANNINAYDIDANNIDANDINYYAVCYAYNNLSCKSIKGRRKNCKHFCLDVDIKIKNQHKITIDNKEIELSQESFNSLKE